MPVVAGRAVRIGLATFLALNAGLFLIIFVSGELGSGAWDGPGVSFAFALWGTLLWSPATALVAAGVGYWRSGARGQGAQS